MIDVGTCSTCILVYARLKRVYGWGAADDRILRDSDVPLSLRARNRTRPRYGPATRASSGASEKQRWGVRLDHRAIQVGHELMPMHATAGGLSSAARMRGNILLNKTKKLPDSGFY